MSRAISNVKLISTGDLGEFERRETGNNKNTDQPTVELP